MDAYVDPARLDHILAQALAPPLEEADRAAVLRLAREILEFGPDVLPADLFAGRSGRPIASLAVQDAEGVARMRPILDLPTDSRVLQLSDGRGFAALLLAACRPQITVHVLEEDDGRAWFWQRLCRVFELRNLRLHNLDAAEWSAAHRGQIDLLLLRASTAHAAIARGLGWLAPNGVMAAWVADGDPASVRRPLEGPGGGRATVEEFQGFSSRAAQPGALLRIVGERTHGAAP